ncbi:MAG TPA: methyltransferase domain-containing protein [Jatrophihabitans sp.]|jgi:predicted SAM-dependent methyltransferase|nr:methyltransferase domain-containing protein [Jatrophihabitans sp.]
MNPRLRRIVRGTVHAANRPVATLRFRAAARRAPRPIALEVGGLKQRAGWFMVNVNAVTPHYMDGTKPWRFEDGSLSHVYADNMIEHVPLAGARVFFAEAYRCLQPGGIIRLVTPDVRTHVDLYLKGADVLKSDLANEYRALGVVIEHPIDMIRTPIGEFGHHSGYVYDFETLDAELQRAGFQPAARRNLHESDDPKLRGLEERSAHGSLQMVVEAVR